MRGSAWIQVIRGPSEEAERWACEVPMVMGEPDLL